MIIVCSLDDLPNVCESIQPKYLVSVIDPGYAPETPKGVKNHLKLGFDDIIEISSNNKIFRLNNDEISQILYLHSRIVLLQARALKLCFPFCEDFR